MKYEPLVPIGYHSFKIPVSKLPMQEMIEWLVDNKAATTIGALGLHEDTRAEDIPIPDDLECFQVLMRRIDVLVQKAKLENVKLELEHIWGQVQDTGQCTAYHYHVNPEKGANMFDVSFVFYLQASPTHGVLEFAVPLHGVDYSRAIYPETGTLITFPSHIPHFTRKNAANTPRVVVSGNYRGIPYGRQRRQI